MTPRNGVRDDVHLGHNVRAGRILGHFRITSPAPSHTGSGKGRPGIEWRPCPSYPGYEASSRGIVRAIGGDPVKSSPLNGYLVVNVAVAGSVVMRGAHVLVCDAFHGPAPEGHEVDHGDTRRDNNRPSNLEWVTPSENARRAWSQPQRRERALAIGMANHLRAKRRRESAGGEA